MHAVDARALLDTGSDIHGKAWPVVFEGLGDYALSASVYAQIPFLLVFGDTESAVRLRSVFFSLFGMLAACWWWKDRQGSQGAWIPGVVFSLAPMWFLHSRTGFEYIQAASLYLIFFILYSSALQKYPRLMTPAAVAAVACFYSYTPARGWIGLAAVLCTLPNLRFHLQHWKTSLIAGTLGVLLALPYILFHFSNPTLANKRLYAVGFGSFILKTAVKVGWNVAEAQKHLMIFNFWHATNRSVMVSTKGQGVQ